MADIKIAGVMRAGAFSPNHIGSDTAIFNAVAEHLRKRGCEVNVYNEEQLIDGRVTENIIINMCRERASVETLQKMEDAGCLVINSGYGIENCIRERMSRILMANNIPYPESIIVNTNEVIRDTLRNNGFEQAWIKRGDFHSMHNEDVTFVRHPEEAQELLQEYFLRGIKRAVINRHLEGDLVKFCGILGDPFFYWMYIFKDSDSEQVMDAVNGSPDELPFDADELKRICSEAASILDVKIYGGECIISDTGKISIIDFNDWPSFASCRNEAALHIARFIMSEIKTFNSNKTK
ncbi:MAG: hypothetical protein K2J42_10205 [Muribaculaceae bacterium]|nr:hypothetical protein [Muribaculaceae bacterium]